MSVAPGITGILEAVLYCTDLGSARGFYQDVLGLRRVGGTSDLSLVFRIDPGHVLLVFDPQASSVPGRMVPSHGCHGAGHIALRIDPDTLEPWRERLAAHGVPIEHTQTWETGATSLYMRDPGDNSVELLTGDIWDS